MSVLGRTVVVKIVLAFAFAAASAASGATVCRAEGDAASSVGKPWSGTASAVASGAVRTIETMLRFDPGLGDRILGARRGVPLYREWAGENMKPATVWPLSQYLSALADLASFSRSHGTVDALIGEIDKYLMNGAYAPSHSSRRFAGTKRLWDDNAWLGLGFLQAYKQTGNAKYLDKARNIVGFMEGGLQKGGGILWEENASAPTLNTCANAPSAQFFLGLYEATREKRHLDDARRIAGVLNGLLRRRDCLYSDHVQAADRSKRDETIWSYNQGAAVGANLQFSLMLSAPAEKKYYMDLARRTADAILAKIGSDPEWLWKQPPAFNCILFRNLLKFDVYSPDPRIRPVLENYLKRAYSQARRASNGAYELGGIGRYGTGETTGITLIDQAAMAQMFAIFAMTAEQLKRLY